MAEPTISDEAVQAFLSGFPFVGTDGDTVLFMTPESVRTGLVAAYPHLRAESVRELERPGSPLCDCAGLDGFPATNPWTGTMLDHHCDCPAVHAAAALLGAYSETEHARQCAHGTEVDGFFAAKVISDGR